MRVKRLFSSENCGGGKYMSAGVVSFVLVFRFTIVYLPMLCANISREEQKQRGKIVMEMWKCELKKFESFFFCLSSSRPVGKCILCRLSSTLLRASLQHDIFGAFCVLCVSFGIVDTIDKM